MPTDAPSPPAPRRGPAVTSALAVLALVAAVPLLWLGVRELREHAGVRQIALQLAGSREAACRVVQPDAAGCPVPADAVRRYRAAVAGDGWLVAGYVLAGLGVFGLTLAYEELGVRITLTDPTGVVPGGADPLEPSEVLQRLNARLSRSAVLRGVIEYPEPFQVAGETAASSTGTLIVAKALVTRDVPYELLSYALKETAFPHQSTGDQFFDHEQFDAYRALGFHIGTAAAAEVTGGRSSGGRRRPG